MKLTRLSAGLLAFTFAVSVLASGSVALAAEQKPDQKPKPTQYTTIQPNLNAGREGCEQSLRTGSAEEVKKYGKERIDKRLRTVERLDKKVDDFYKKRSETFKSKVDSTETTMNRYTPGSEKDIDTKLPGDNKQALKKKISDRKKLLESFAGKLKNAVEVGDMVVATCGTIFESAVYGKLVPEVKGQMTLDNLSMRNTINGARYEATNYIYSKNKNNAKVEAKLKAINDSVSSMPNPASNRAALEQAQSKLNSGQSVTDELNNLNNLIVKKQSPEISGTMKKVTSSVKPAYKKSSSSSSSGGGSSNSGSSGGSNNSGGGSTGGSDSSRNNNSSKTPKKKKSSKRTKVGAKTYKGSVSMNVPALQQTVMEPYTCAPSAKASDSNCEEARAAAWVRLKAKVNGMIREKNKRKSKDQQQATKKQVELERKLCVARAKNAKQKGPTYTDPLNGRKC